MLGFQVPRVPEALLLADDGARLRRALTRTGLSQARAEHYTRRMLEPGGLTGALAWYRALPLSRDFSAGRIHVPTVHLHGRRDPFFAEAGAVATARFVRARFRTRALDAGHWLPETHPHEVAEAVLSAAG